MIFLSLSRTSCCHWRACYSFLTLACLTAVRLFCIFMASITQISWPSATYTHSSTWSLEKVQSEWCVFKRRVSHQLQQHNMLTRTPWWTLSSVQSSCSTAIQTLVHWTLHSPCQDWNMNDWLNDWLDEVCRGSVTVSPGLTDTATTVPGIGDRRMLLVSSATFSGMKELSCAANLDRMRTWNCWRPKETVSLYYHCNIQSTSTSNFLCQCVVLLAGDKSEVACKVLHEAICFHVPGSIWKQMDT